MVKTFLAALALTGVLAAGGAAHAQWILSQPGNHQSRIGGEVYGVLNPVHPRGEGVALGAGARLNVPLTRNGPFGSFNNALGVYVGGDVFWQRSPFDLAQNTTGTVGLIIPLGLRWGVYFHELFSAFAEVGTAIEVFGCCMPYAWPGAALGGRVRFARNSGPELLFRFAYPTGMNLGIAF